MRRIVILSALLPALLSCSNDSSSPTAVSPPPREPVTPAAIAGTWTASLTGQVVLVSNNVWGDGPGEACLAGAPASALAGPHTATLELTQQGGQLAGFMTFPSGLRFAVDGSVSSSSGRLNYRGSGPEIRLRCTDGRRFYVGASSGRGGFGINNASISSGLQLSFYASTYPITEPSSGLYDGGVIFLRYRMEAVRQ